MVIRMNESDLLETISRVYHIAVLVYDTNGMILERFSPNPESDEILFIVSHCKEQLLDLCAQTRQPQIVTSEINQLWAGLPVLGGDTITRLIVLGPVHTSEYSKNVAIDYVRSYHFSIQHKDELLEALSQTPVCPYVELTKLLSIIYSLVYGEILDTSSLTISGLVKDQFTFAGELHTYLERHLDVDDDAHLDYDFEQHLMECVREGRLEALKRLLRTASYNQAEIHNSDDPIRQWKNSFIILVTLITRAAVEGGFNPQIAYSLRDLYIQRVETMHSFPAILQLHREILYEVTMRMSERKRMRDYSRLVNQCCDYIEEHIREKLQITDFASFVGFKAHYISRKFKEETGQSIKDYIKEAKVNEAKSLLKYSRLSLSEISELLSFSTQSFFTETFRRVTGVTPAQYRKSGGESD